MSNKFSINQIAYNLENTNHNIVDKLNYFMDLINKQEKYIKNVNVSEFAILTEYTIANTINKYLKVTTNFFEKTNPQTKLPNKFTNNIVRSIFPNIRPSNTIFTIRGEIDNTNIDILKSFNDYFIETAHKFNIFIKHSNKYYQTNNNYIITEYTNNISNSKPNNKMIYNIFNVIFKTIFNSIIKNTGPEYAFTNSTFNAQHNTMDYTLNHIISLVFIMFTNIYIEHFIYSYYKKLYNIVVTLQEEYYTNIIIDLDDYNVYRLDSVNYKINNTKNGFSFHDSSNQCYNYDVCNYHVIKGSYSIDNGINILVYTLNNYNDSYKLDSSPTKFTIVNIDTLPIMKFDSKLLLYTRHSDTIYIYNKYINLLKDNILFIHI